MKTIVSIEEYRRLTGGQETFLLFIKTDGCSVCDSLLPQVEALEAHSTLPFHLVNVSRLPELAGELLLFAAPVVILFYRGREYSRFARFVPMEELKKKITALEAELDV